MTFVKNKFFSPKLNLLLYSMLLVCTPFILLQNFLQDVISQFSRSSFEIAKLDIPYTLSIFLIIVLFLSIKFRKTFNTRIIISWLVAFLYWFIGQKSVDYYMNKEFYDLQNNWHYIAYGLFTIVAYNSFSIKPRNLGRMILHLYSLALLISVFDETIQVFISKGQLSPKGGE